VRDAAVLARPLGFLVEDDDIARSGRLGLDEPLVTIDGDDAQNLLVECKRPLGVTNRTGNVCQAMRFDHQGFLPRSPTFPRLSTFPSGSRHSREFFWQGRDRRKNPPSVTVVAPPSTRPRRRRSRSASRQRARPAAKTNPALADDPSNPPECRSKVERPDSKEKQTDKQGDGAWSPVDLVEGGGWPGTLVQSEEWRRPRRRSSAGPVRCRRGSAPERGRTNGNTAKSNASSPDLGPDEAAHRPMAAARPPMSSLPAQATWRHHLRWEPDAGNPLVRICGGGAQRWASLLRLDFPRGPATGTFFGRSSAVVGATSSPLK